jgi:hypothetical protein
MNALVLIAERNQHRRIIASGFSHGVPQFDNRGIYVLK